MKKLFLTPLLLMLSGCVTYYYPVTGPDGEVYYTEEPPEEVTYTVQNPEQVYEDIYYVEEEPTYLDWTSSYASAAYYPWWSVDYFYLGSRHRHSSFSFGFNYGFGYNYGWHSPIWNHHYPYTAIYYPLHWSLWYSPFYDRHHLYWGWNDYYWRHRYDRYYYHDRWGRNRYAGNYGRRDRGDRRGDRHQDAPGSNRDLPYQEREPLRDETAFAGNNRNRDANRRRGEDGLIPGAAQPRDPARGGRGGRGEEAPMSRHVSVATTSKNANRGMEVRNRSERKPLKTRTEPVKSATQLSPSTRLVTGNSESSVPGASAGSNRSPSSNRPVHRSAGPVTRSTRGSSGEIRSRAGSKNRTTRPSPVRQRPAAPVVRTEPVIPSSHSGSTGVVTRQSGNTQIRSNAQRKATRSRTEPVRPQPSRPAVSNSRRSEASVSRRTQPAPSVNRIQSVPRVTAAPSRQPSGVSRPAPAQRSAPPPRQSSARPASRSSKPAARPESQRKQPKRENSKRK